MMLKFVNAEQTEWCNNARKHQQEVVKMEKDIDQSMKAESSNELYSELEHCYNEDKQVKCS